MRQMTVGSLFAGIGGFEIGFERQGFKVLWQVEIDEKCRERLARRFPEAKRFGDIRECGAHNLERVDVICGGFPCQPFSQAGRRQGTADNRYLWPEMLRIISTLRPRWVVAENVSGLLSLDDGRVLDAVYTSLEAEGYETLPPLVLPACAFGAGHRRDRVWIVAHSAGDIRRTSGDDRPQSPDRESAGDVAHTDRTRPQGREVLSQCSGERTSRPGGVDAADSASTRPLPGTQRGVHRGEESTGPRDGEPERPGCAVSHTSSAGFPDWAGGEVGQPSPLTEFERPDGREVERDFRGVAYGVSHRVDRLKALGNAIVPQIAEWLASRILAAEEGR